MLTCILISQFSLRPPFSRDCTAIEACEALDEPIGPRTVKTGTLRTWCRRCSKMFQQFLLGGCCLSACSGGGRSRFGRSSHQVTGSIFSESSGAQIDLETLFYPRYVPGHLRTDRLLSLSPQEVSRVGIRNVHERSPGVLAEAEDAVWPRRAFCVQHTTSNGFCDLSPAVIPLIAVRARS